MQYGAIQQANYRIITRFQKGSARGVATLGGAQRELSKEHKEKRVYFFINIFLAIIKRKEVHTSFLLYRYITYLRKPGNAEIMRQISAEGEIDITS